MKTSFTSLLFIFIYSLSYSQSYKVTGTVQDSTDAPLIGATVVLLSPTDSVMTGFAITNGKGVFTIDDVKQGDQVLQITYIGYGTFENNVTVRGEGKSVDLGTIKLAGNTNLLDAVEIKGRFIPIVIKKDTVEYNADAYRVRPNATVEELLKKMPGIEVDKDGAITAQGEEVTKVTVDGKKFFGNDPKAATKNLPADAIKKVQVIDEKSKSAQFSGVDDGEDTKTINLELKEDKKKGYFGNVKAGYGTSDRVDRGNGDSKNLSGGLNLNYDLGNKSTFSTSYYLINTDVNVFTGRYTENRLASNSSINQDTSIASSLSNQHVIFSSLDLRIDSSQTIDLELGLTVRDDESNSDRLTELSRLTGNLVSETETLSDTEGSTIDVDGSLDYNLRLGKKSQVLSLEATYGRVEASDSLDIFQEILAPSEIQAIKLNQFQLDTSTNNNFRVQLGYKQPIGKKQYLDLKYTRRNFSKYRIRDFIDKDPFARDLDLSSATDNSTNFDQYQMAYTLDKSAFLFKVGMTYHNSFLGNEEFDYNGNNMLVRNDNRSLDSRSFSALLPSMNLNLFDRALRISYRTSLDEPSLNDLQTIVDNTDPNEITLGNPELQPEYEHRVRVRFNKFDRFTLRSIFASLTYTKTNDNIVDSIATDANLVQTIKPINGNGSTNIGGFISSRTPIKPLYVKLGLSANGGVSTREVYVDNQLNNVTSLSPSVKIDLENLNNDMFTILAYTRTTWNYNNYDQNEQLDSRFLTQTYGGEFIIEMGKGFVFDTEIDYFQYFNDGDRINDYALWNASLSKTFLNDKLTVKLTGFDLLDQNKGIDISQTNTSLSKSTANTLQRFGMLTMIYKLSSFGGSGGGKSNRVMIVK